MKKIFFGIILFHFMLFSLYAENIRFDNRNFIDIDVPVNWQVVQSNGTPLPEMGKTFDLELTAPPDEKALLMVTIGKSKTGEQITQKQYDAITKTIATEYLKESVEKKAVFIELPVRNGNGKYCSFTDASLANKAPGPNDFVYAVLFLANYANGSFLYATGLTDDLSGTSFQNMVKAISSLEPSLETIVQTPPIQIKKNNQGTLIGNEKSKVKLLIPSKNIREVKEQRERSQNNPGYFYFVDSKTNLNISGWFEPAEKFMYDGSMEFWASEYKKDNVLNPEFRKNEVWEVFIYDIPVPGEFTDVCSAHMRAHFLQDGIWIDLHLSITARKSSSILHDELATYIKTLQIVKQ
jgi:hypothetical protein